MEKDPKKDILFHYKSANHSDIVLKNLNALRTSETLCDITFLCEGRQINAHRAVLCANTSYFKCMFNIGMIESSAKQVPIKGVCGEAFERLIDYCYTSEIVIESHNVKALLSAASILDFQEIQDACEQFLLDRITIENCVSISLYASHHSCNKLLEGSDTYTRAHFLEVTRCAEFSNLELEHLVKLISHDELKVSSEIEVFNAVVKWVKHDEDKRRSLLPDILEHVRFGVMSPKILLDCVQTEILVSENVKCKSLLDEATAYHLLPQRRSEFPTIRSKARTYLASSIYAVGGENNTGIKLASVERYDSEVNRWIQVAPMNMGRSSVGVTSCNGALYCGGGFGGRVFLNSVECYTPYDDTWKVVAPLACPRSCLGMVCLDDFVYAIGGRREDARLATVERYDCHRDQWFDSSRMATSRSAAGVTVIDGCIYVAGGYDGYTDLNTVERYDPRIDKWCMVAPMKKKRSLTAAVTLKGCIYVPGGQILMTLLDSVECYDPRNNLWYPMSPLLSSRYGCGAAVLGENMFVAGGCDGAHRLSSLEIYDPVRNTWSTMEPMSDQRHSLGITAL
ncbi:kelch-like protein diablo [Bolinopsis microptera]|uniref:kelch-like protein diablo n=1 Tax=Bolinopsis microptera TaxID=2820187 RepID=UPI003079EC43